MIEELQKVAFIQGLPVQKLFENTRGAQNGAIYKTMFRTRIMELQLTWSDQNTEDFFNKICQFQANGRYDEIMASSIDLIVHFKCNKTLKALHAVLLLQFLHKSTSPGMPSIDHIFENIIQQSGGQYGQFQQSYQKTCTMRQLQDVLRSY